MLEKMPLGSYIPDTIVYSEIFSIEVTDKATSELSEMRVECGILHDTFRHDYWRYMCVLSHEPHYVVKEYVWISELLPVSTDRIPPAHLMSGKEDMDTAKNLVSEWVTAWSKLLTVKNQFPKGDDWPKNKEEGYRPHQFYCTG